MTVVEWRPAVRQKVHMYIIAGAWIVCIVVFLWRSANLPTEEVVAESRVNGGYRNHGMSKHWTAAKSMKPRREQAVIAFQRLARNKVFSTGVAVSPKPPTNDMREAGGSVRRIRWEVRDQTDDENLRQHCRR